MNIFFLDRNPKICAAYHCDKHVIKMTLEYAQILSTTQRLFGNESRELYGITHVNHPSVVWTRESANNYRWLYELFIETARQYEERYGRKHLSYRKLRDELIMPPPELEEKEMTAVRLAMPDEYRGEDPVESYRRYYIGDKARFAAWTLPAHVPEWFRPTYKNEKVNDTSTQ